MGGRATMCQVRVKRDKTVKPGAGSWFEVEGELLFIVSAKAVSEDGAASLEAVWQAFADSGLWRWKAEGGRPVEVVYARMPLPDGLAVRITSHNGLVCAQVDPAHFSVAAARGLQGVAKECARAGWTHHEPFPAMASGQAVA